MATEDELKIKVTVEGSEESTSKLGEVTGAVEKHERAVHSAGESHTHFAHKVRGAAHIVTGSIGQMAGAVDPELGRIVQSLGVGAHMFRYFGAQIAIAVVAVEAVSTAVSFYIRKLKEAEDFQLNLNKALRGFDLHAVSNQIEKIDEQIERFVIRGETLQKPILGIGDAVRYIAVSWQMLFTNVDHLMEERNRAEQVAMEIYIRSGETQQNVLKIETERAKVAEESAGLDVKRAQTTGELAEALARQEEATKKLRELEISLNYTKELAKLTEEAHKSTTEATTAAIVNRINVLKEQHKAEMDILNIKSAARQFEDVQKVRGDAEQKMQEAISIGKKLSETRLIMVDQAEREELSRVEYYASNRLEVVEGTERARTEFIREAADERRTAIDTEAAAWRTYAAAYQDNAKVQMEAQRHLVSLNEARVKNEVDANNKIISEREKLNQALRQKALDAAAIGGSLADKALAQLEKERPGQFYSQADIDAKVELMRQQAMAGAQAFDLGGALQASDIRSLREWGDILGKMREKGVSETEAMHATWQQMGAQFGLRISPEEMVGKTIAEPTQEIHKMFEEVKTQSAQALDQIRSMIAGADVGGVNFANAIVDMIVRKLEFEAAGQI